MNLWLLILFNSWSFTGFLDFLSILYCQMLIMDLISTEGIDRLVILMVVIYEQTAKYMVWNTYL